MRVRFRLYVADKDALLPEKGAMVPSRYRNSLVHVVLVLCMHVSLAAPTIE